MKRNRGIKSKHVLILMTVLCLISIILTVNTRDRVSPIERSVAYIVVPMQRGIMSFGGWIQDKVDFVSNIRHLEEENETLQERVYQLEQDNNNLQQDRFELDRLRELYDLDEKYADYPKVGARVIGKDPGNWYNNFLIDKGSNDGLKVNMNVIAGNGLVGYISEVGPNYSKVVSIIDDVSSVSGMFLRTSDLGIVNGSRQLMDQGYLTVENINRDANIVNGDEVVTSHISDLYLQGILIGTIREIQEVPNSLTKSALLEPAVNFNHLQEVLVITELKQVD
ncbi:rod shape-determining protein MreC [Natranaerovirga hydrolytica]|uniref:Cell shape-determining protein MreC n=1 Tax=Natranaerovirga hydrolytica TaxID=680378 RepID=A0A4R1MXT9_9FIRM|nr:rod shape-determining protein MreC [Natranaerovirga hydrolytica]TCK98087.1 rod shape-determining protein MreC [Natranaerovirga hydrolytica]